MPTASSAQIIRKIIRIKTTIMILYFILFTFLNTSSIIRPEAISKTPAIKKSKRFQFTSFVNCIANNGISKSIAIVSMRIISLLFCIIINVPNVLDFQKPCYISKIMNFQIHKPFDLTWTLNL